MKVAAFLAMGLCLSLGFLLGRTYEEKATEAKLHKLEEAISRRADQMVDRVVDKAIERLRAEEEARSKAGLEETIREVEKNIPQRKL